MSVIQRIARRLRAMRRKAVTVGTEESLRAAAGNDVLHEDEHVVVIHRPGSADAADCIVSFTGIGRAMGEIDVQTPEFSRSGDGSRKIFVIDRTRSWGNALDWELIARLVGEVAAPGERIVTLGNSMGGFLAIAAAQHLRAEQAVAFAPQWSVHPDVVPFDWRWGTYREAIADWRIPDLGDALRAPCQFHLIFGDDPLDLQHFALFPPPEAGRLETCVVNRGRHEIAAFLKEKGLLYPTIEACLAGRSAAETLRAADVDAVG